MINAAAIDIHEPIFELCRRLGLVPENVMEITFKPNTVIAVVFTLNEDGNKHINPDGRAATHTIRFRVRT